MEDSFEIVEPEPVILHTPTLWLIGQAFELLNAASEAAAVACAHVVQLLKCRDDALDTLTKVLRSSPAEDIGLRWNALYLVGEIGDRSAADLLYRVAVEDIPKSCEDVKACESPRDGEVLVRTMAVEALQRVAERDPEAGETMLAVVAAQPTPPVLIEAVKAARALQLGDKAAKRLRKEQQWMLDIKIQRVQEVMAKPERADDAAVGFTPPGVRTARLAPAADCCTARVEG
jgi:hypothetical protein